MGGFADNVAAGDEQAADEAAANQFQHVFRGVVADDQVFSQGGHGGRVPLGGLEHRAAGGPGLVEGVPGQARHRQPCQGQRGTGPGGSRVAAAELIQGHGQAEAQQQRRHPGTQAGEAGLALFARPYQGEQERQSLEQAPLHALPASLARPTAFQSSLRVRNMVRASRPKMSQAPMSSA